MQMVAIFSKILTPQILCLILIPLLFGVLSCAGEESFSGTPFVLLENLEEGSKYEDKIVAVTGYLYPVTYRTATSTIFHNEGFNYILFSRIEHASLGLDSHGVFISGEKASLDLCIGEYVQTSGVFRADNGGRKYIENSGYALGAIGLRNSVFENDKSFFLEAYTDCETGNLDTGD